LFWGGEHLCRLKARLEPCYKKERPVTLPICKSPVLDYLEELHARYRDLNEGAVATYIPELAKANPDWFGICLVTASGAIYEAGDSRQHFTIQSISKPFVYGLALEDQGRAAVLGKVGVEPTGDAFNSISLDPGTGRPRNPMINAGAIATAGLVEGRTPALRLKRLLEMFGRYTGSDLGLDEAVYRSESLTGHRNRAIGYMLRNFDILGGDPTPVVELYFQQCSVAVTCRDLGIMAATLANRGVNPVTGKQAIRGEYVESVLSVMGSCGMYDYAGEWIYNIGMPAKSGVSGGVIAVLPGQLGIGVFSPRLDSRGNTVRGIRVCGDLSRYLDLHLLNRPSVGKVALRFKCTGSQLHSSRVRTTPEAKALLDESAGIRIYQLQGNLTFATAEAVIRDIMESLESTEYLLVDFKHVLSLNESACRLFYHLLRKITERDNAMLFVHTDRLPLLRRYMKAKLNSQCDEIYRTFEDDDLALEWCENEVLAKALPGWNLELRAEAVEYSLFQKLSPDEIAQVTRRMKRQAFQRGEPIVVAGHPASEIIFLARGQASVFLSLAEGRRKRLATFSAGMVFGEMAVIEGAPRSATVIADTEAECDLLSADDFEALSQSHPQIKIKLLENLSRTLSTRLREARQELQVLS
jgi:glutaminase